MKTGLVPALGEPQEAAVMSLPLNWKGDLFSCLKFQKETVQQSGEQC